MSTKVFYPPCQWLDPNTRDAKGTFIASFAAAMLNPLPRSISTIADIVYSRMIAARRIVIIVTAKPAFLPYKEML